MAIFIRRPDGSGMIYDLGSSDEFSPLDFINDQILSNLSNYEHENMSYRIPQLIMSHPHNDHISEIGKIETTRTDDNNYPSYVTCPHNRKSGEINIFGYEKDERFDFDRLGEAKETDQISSYMDLISGRMPPLQTVPPEGADDGFEYGIFYVRPPEVAELHEVDQHYINGSSVCLYLKYGDNSILIPGDITPEAMKAILDNDESVERRYSIHGQEHKENWCYENDDQPTLSELLEDGLTVLVASHHGLESGFSPELYEAIGGGKPDFVAISEKRKPEDSPGTVDSRYQGEDGANGIEMDNDGEIITPAYSLGTRSNRHMAFVFDSDGEARFYAREKEEDLLEIA